MSETEQETPPEEETETTEPVDDDPDQTEGTEDEVPTEEPEPEPEPEQPSDEDRAKLAKALDTRFTNYRNSVEKILADEVADWLLCPLCVSSMAPGYVNRHDLGRVPEEVQANVQMYLGFQREQEYEQDPDTQMCPTCKGRRKLKTGATDGDYIVHKCKRCNGFGFVPPPTGTPNGSALAGTPEEAVAAALADFDTEERDNWGEPRILPDGSPNSNFGKMPQFKQVHPVYGVTANLSPEELVSG